jgi:hypothetical protein
VSLVDPHARDPHARFEDAGSQVTTFPLVITEPGKEGQTFSLCVGCESYGRTAEHAATLSAEDVVSVEGKLKYPSSIDKQGQKKSTLCVLVRALTVLVPSGVAAH